MVINDRQIAHLLFYRKVLPGRKLEVVGQEIIPCPAVARKGIFSKIFENVFKRR